MILNYFFSDLSKVKENDNPNGVDYESEKGGTLFIGKGELEYSSDKHIEDIKYLIQGAYFSELDYRNKSDKQINDMCEEQEIKNILAKIEKIYIPNKEESIKLLNGVKINAEKLIERQALEIEKFDLQDYIDIGKYHQINEDMIPQDCYYLILGVNVDDIPIMGVQEPYVSTADEDAIYQNTYIEVIANSSEIFGIKISGAYSFNEKEENERMEFDEVCDTLVKKYGMQILTSEYTICNAWLEYVYIADPKAENIMDNGELKPYWCFEIVNEDDDEEGYAERINAISGGDLAYGE